MEKQIIKIDNWYQKLLIDLKKLEFTGIVLTKWNIGKRILEDFEKFGKPEYGNKRIESIAKDIKIETSDLYRCIQFAEQYPQIRPPVENSSWREVRKLLVKIPRKKISQKITSIPEGKYDVIYADPPWQYDNVVFGDPSREIESHYPTLSLEEICKIEIPSTKEAILFLWSPAPLIHKALEVMKNWGFDYRTNAIWNKEVMGMGYWFRIQHEILLIGIKGKYPTPPPQARTRSIYNEKRGKHSKKPDYYYSLIEKMYPSGKYLELFARNKRKNWISWGNEI